MGENQLVIRAYVDLIWLINFIMDFFMLWVTGRIVHLPTKFCRLCLGSAVGAFYTLLLFFPGLPLGISFLSKSICAVLMVLLVFYPQKPGKFIRALFYFYAVSFAMGGAVFAAAYYFRCPPGGQWVFNLAGIITALFLGYSGFFRGPKNYWQRQLLNQLTICFPENNIEVTALLDTGNQLTDPLSKKPVIVVESAVLEQILPPVLRQKMNSGAGETSELLASLDENWAARIRLIPYNSVGKKHGLMVGLCPDRVVIKNKQQEITTSEVVLGLVNRALSAENRYKALLHPLILQSH